MDPSQPLPLLVIISRRSRLSPPSAPGTQMALPPTSKVVWTCSQGSEFPKILKLYDEGKKTEM